MYNIQTVITTLLLSSLSLVADDFNKHLQENLYAPAKEMMEMQDTMTQEMNALNAQPQQIENLDGSKAMAFSDEPMSELNDMGDHYLLEKNISDANQSTVKVSIEEDMIKILITKAKVVKMSDFKQEINATNTEMHSVPYDADATKMKSSYSDGLLKITLPKKTK